MIGRMQRMIQRYGVVFFAIGLVWFSSSEVSGKDWIFYGGNEKYIYFYDFESINFLSKDIVRVSDNQKYTKEGQNFMVEKLGEKYENLSHTITLWEINCAEKKFRILNFTHYSDKNKPIYSWKLLYSSNSPDEWSPFTPGSFGERLYKAVCK